MLMTDVLIADVHMPSTCRRGRCAVGACLVCWAAAAAAVGFSRMIVRLPVVVTMVLAVVVTVVRLVVVTVVTLAVVMVRRLV